MSTDKKVPNLDLVSEVAGSIAIGGVEHAIQDLDGLAYRELKSAEGTDRYTEVAYATVARIMPTLTAEQVDKLTGRKVGIILGIADGRVIDIESQFPNGSGPETTIPTSPA